MGEASDVVVRYFKALSAGGVDSAVDLVADGGDFRTPMGALHGKDQIRGYLGVFEAAFPRAAYDLDKILEDRGKVAAEGTYRAVHQGPMVLPDGMTLAATGRQVETPFVTMLDVEAGAIVSHRPY